MFVYQPTSNVLRLKKKTKALIIFLTGNQRGYTVLNLHHYILLSWIGQIFLYIEQE